MTNKNPYENGVDIPDFIEKKDDDIDMSVFKMAQDETTGNSFDIDDEDDYDDEPKRKLSSKGLLIIGGAALVVLLIAAIAGWIFGISKNNSLTKLQAEYTTLETKLNEANTSITSLNNQITLLNTEIEKYKSSGSGDSGNGTPTASGTKYKFAEGIAVRKGASSSNEYVSFSKLPDAVQDAVYENNGEVRTRDGAVAEVYETKNDSEGNLWGKVADNAWVCLKYQGEEWATKQ